MPSKHPYGSKEFELEVKQRAADLKAALPEETFTAFPAEFYARIAADPDGFGKFMNNLAGPVMLKHAKGLNRKARRSNNGRP